MKLLHKTRGNAPINGKQLIFVHATASDHSDRDRVMKMILDSENGGNYAVLYADGAAFPVDFDTPELSRIHLYVPVITKDYLIQCDKGLDFSILIAKYGFDILPVVQNADLIPAFNERFKNIHAITLTMQNPALEIEKLLSRMLVSAELIEEIIRDAFTRRLFLSYRKKDKAEVTRIMKAVHNTRWARAAAIWFDDFLVPGTDFESGIDQAMRESDAVIFAVTNNLPKPNDEGKPNYVCQTEYPEAVKLGKKLIAVEAEPTPKEKLKEALGDSFPESVPVDDVNRMNHAFDRLGGEEPEPDPYVQYLRGMAYLLGVRVEKDIEKAVSILSDCVKKEVPEAMMQLSYMYSRADSADYDLKKAIEMRNKAFQAVMKRPLCFEKLEYLNEIAFGSGGYGGVAVGLGNKECDDCYHELINEVLRFKKDSSASIPSGKNKNDLDIFLLDAHAHLGNIEIRTQSEISEKGFSYFESHLETSENYRRDASFGNKKEYYRVCAEFYSIYCSLFRAKNRLDEAIKKAKSAIEYQKKLVDECEPSFEARWSLATYKGNLMGCEYLKRERLAYKNKNALESVEEFEALYAEKKDPQLGEELVLAYGNMCLTTGIRKKKRQYRAQANKRLKEVKKDFPYYAELQKMDPSTKENRRKRVADFFDRAKLPLAIIQLLLVAFACKTGFQNLDFSVVSSWILGTICGGITFFGTSRKSGLRVLFSIVFLLAAGTGLMLLIYLAGINNPILFGLLFFAIGLISVFI